MKYNINNIKNMTNNKISYDKYEKENNIKMQKIKKVSMLVMVIAISLIGIITVNAATGGQIKENIIKILENGDNKNATCTKNKNGNLSCKVDKEVIGKDIDIIYEINEDTLEKENMKVSSEYNKDNGEVSIEINNK